MKDNIFHEVELSPSFLSCRVTVHDDNVQHIIDEFTTTSPEI